MKRIVIYIIALLTILPVFATTAKVDGMLSPFWSIDDDSFIVYRPASIFRFSDTAVFEGMLSDYNGGFNTSLGDNLKLGFYFNKPYAGYLNFIGSDPYGPEDTVDPGLSTYNVSNYFDIIIGFRAGPMDIGLDINYSGVNGSDLYDLDSSTPAFGDYKYEYSDKLSETCVTLDLTMNALGAIDRLSFLARIGFMSAEIINWEEDYNGTTWDIVMDDVVADAGMSMAFALIGDVGSWKGYASYVTNSLSYQYDYIVDDDKDDSYETHRNLDADIGLMLIQAGISKDIIWKKLKITAGTYFTYLEYSWDNLQTNMISENITNEYNSTEGYIEMPVFASMELAVTKWFYLRFGIGSEIMNTRNGAYEDPDYTGGVQDDLINFTGVYKDYPSSYTRLGVGFKVYRINFDFAVSTTELFDLFILTGDTGNPLYSASMKFHW